MLRIGTAEIGTLYDGDKCQCQTELRVPRRFATPGPAARPSRLPRTLGQGKGNPQGTPPDPAVDDGSSGSPRSTVTDCHGNVDDPGLKAFKLSMGLTE